MAALGTGPTVVQLNEIHTRLDLHWGTFSQGRRAVYHPARV